MRSGVALLLAVCCSAAVLGQAETAAVEGEVTNRRHRVSGLGQPAEILVDRWGVPHVYAADQDDLFFAQGFNAARDRLWQLDVWKRRGDGTLAEVLGPDYVEKDRAARLLLFRGDMHAEWLAYASDTKRIVTAFVAGINAFVELTEADEELLPPEFRLLGYRPARWSPETVVRIRSHGLLRNARSELSRALFVRRFGLGSLAAREVLQPDHEVEIPEGLDLGVLSQDMLDVYRLGTGGVDFSPYFEEREEEGAGAEEGELAALEARMALGSNNWAVAPHRTATGRAILADDPHRLQAMPSLRYIAPLAAPGLDVIGAGEPALPGVSIGHNGRIAFGLTIFSIDQEDLYVYETRAGRPDEYRYRGRWEPMSVVTESIPVRDAEAVEVELHFTRHGPVLFEDPESRRAVALRAAWLQPGMAPYLGSIEYMRATDWDDFLAAMNRWGAPSENQVYADTEGNIGWKPGGLAPIRPNWDGLLPVPGDGSYEWSGFRDMDELPILFNPERGWVHSANEMNLPAGYPHALGYEWRLPYRADRIAEVLAVTPAMTVADSLRLQTDYVSLPARRVLAVIGALAGTEEGGDRPQERALELLHRWDGELSPESAAAALFEVWLSRHLGQAVLADLVAPKMDLDDNVLRPLGRGNLEIVLRHLEAAARGTAEEREAMARAVRRSLGDAVITTERKLGKDWQAWRWGDLHHASLRHPLAEHLPPSLAAAAEVGPLPRGGSGDTVGNTSYDRQFRQISGASFRMVLDVGAWDDSLAMNSPGQSGDPRSSHYADLFPRWAADEAFPLLYSRARVEAATRLRIVLEPGRSGPASATP